MHILTMCSLTAAFTVWEHLLSKCVSRLCLQTQEYLFSIIVCFSAKFPLFYVFNPFNLTVLEYGFSSCSKYRQHRLFLPVLEVTMSCWFYIISADLESNIRYIIAASAFPETAAMTLEWVGLLHSFIWIKYFSLHKL